jgi:hypothetical protein
MALNGDHFGRAYFSFSKQHLTATEKNFLHRLWKGYVPVSLHPDYLRDLLEFAAKHPVPLSSFVQRFPRLDRVASLGPKKSSLAE